MATTPSEAFWPSECVAWNCEPELTSLLGRQPPPKALAAPRTDALSWACAVADVAATTPRLLRAGATGACHGYRVRRTML